MRKCKTDSVLFNGIFSDGEDITSELTEPQKTYPASPVVHDSVAIE